MNREVLGSWPMATKSPDTSRSDSSSLMVVPDPDAGCTVVSPEDVDDRGVPPEVDLRVGEGPLLHDLGGPQLAASVDDGDLVGEPGEEEGLFEGGVPATDDGDVPLAEEESVAGGTGGHPVAEQALLVGQVEHQRLGPGGDDQRLGRVGRLVGVGVADPQAERPARTGRPGTPWP